jgi:glycosyltransferase involved in cell wall biosynthesis
MPKAKILICIGTMGRPTFKRCYESVLRAKAAFSQKTDLHIIKNKSPQSEWLNSMRKAALGWDWCFQIDEDMYLYENAFEDLYRFAIEKSKKTKVLSASSLLYDLFLERKIGSFKIWNSQSLKKLTFSDVLGSDRDIAKRGALIGLNTVATNLVLGDHDSAPNTEIAYNKYYKYVEKLKKFGNQKDIEYIINFLQSKSKKDNISKSALRGALDAKKALAFNPDSSIKENYIFDKKFYKSNKKIFLKDKISVIVTCFNKEKYISKCIDSILSQNYLNFELIIIDDFSSDKSLNIINNYKHLKNVKIFKSKENLGAYPCRNFGIKKSKGKYVTFVDGDDYIGKNHIFNLYKTLVNNKAKASISLYEDNKAKICEPSILLNKDVFKDIGFYENVKCGADTEFRRRFDYFYPKKIALSKVITYFTMSRSLSKNGKFKKGGELRGKYSNYIVSKQYDKNKKINYNNLFLEIKGVSCNFFDESWFECTNKDTIYVSITTFNRRDNLLKLMDQLKKENEILKKNDIELKVLISNDCSDQDYRLVENYCKSMNWHYFVSKKNFKKEEHWRLYNTVLNKFKNWYNNFETNKTNNKPLLFFFLQDDNIMTSNIFLKTLSLSEKIKEVSNKEGFVLNLYKDKTISTGIGRWSGLKIENFDSFIKCNFVDGMFCLDAKALSFINWKVDRIPLSRWKNKPNLSSGVGQQITRKLCPKTNIFMPKKSYLNQQDCNSQMQDKNRKNPSAVDFEE